MEFKFGHHLQHAFSLQFKFGHHLQYTSHRKNFLQPESIPMLLSNVHVYHLTVAILFETWFFVNFIHDRIVHVHFFDPVIHIIPIINDAFQLTLLFDSCDVYWNKGASSGVPGPENVLAHAAWDSRERGGDEAEGRARLHHGPRTARADRQPMRRGQVARQVHLQLEVLHKAK